MSENSLVRGTLLQSSPCTVQEAASLLQRFLEGETIPESSLARGYLVSVFGALDELVAIRTPKQKERGGKRKSLESAIGDAKTPESTGLQPQLGISPELLENGSKQGSHSKKKSTTSELGSSEHDTHVKHRSRKKHRVADSGHNEYDASKLTSAQVGDPAYSGASEDNVADVSHAKKRSRIESINTKPAVLEGVHSRTKEVGIEKPVSVEGFSVHTRDPDGLRNDAHDGVGGVPHSKRNSGKGLHSKSPHRAAAEPPVYVGVDAEPGDKLKGTHLEPEDHAVGPGKSEHETSKEVRKKKKKVDMVNSEGNKDTEKKHSHKKKK